MFLGVGLFLFAHHITTNLNRGKGLAPSCNLVPTHRQETSPSMQAEEDIKLFRPGLDNTRLFRNPSVSYLSFIGGYNGEKEDESVRTEL